MSKREDSPKKSAGAYDRLFPFLTALVGVAAGAAASLLTTGHIESVRLAEARKSQSVAAYVEKAWGGVTAKDRLEFTRALSSLSVCSSKEVIAAVAAYHAEDCAAKGDPPHCRELWTNVVQQLRRENKMEEAPKEQLMLMLWGKQ